MANIIYLSENDEHRAREIDKKAGIKNAFRWEWLQRSVTVQIGSDESKTYLVDHIRKVETPGKVLCTLCQDLVSYASRGGKNIEDHISTKKHKEKLKLLKTNHCLPGAISKDESYGVHPMFKNVVPAGSTSKFKEKPLVSMQDRKLNQQAMVLGVLAENNFPFTAAPTLIDLAKELAKDKRALNDLSMNRTTASYKLNHGLSKTFREQTLNNIRSCKFSLNIDESTSKNHKRVLAILVSYFCKDVGQVVTEHLASVEVIKVDAQSLYDTLVSLFDNYSIPWTNLVSLLMDSCAVMRGQKSGLEARIRETKAPHLLDIDGDICHHVHNACKKFCAPFDYYAERLFLDLHNDIKWSPDLNELMAEVCELLNIKYTMPEKFISHRWLSVYDLAISTLRILPGLQVFYFAFLPITDKGTYREVLDTIFEQNGVGTESRKRVRQIHAILSKKNLTNDGKARKERLVQKVLYTIKKTMLILNLYQSVLDVMKSYVCLFQGSEPLCHILHDKIEELFREFLSFYIQPQALPQSAGLLKHFDLNADVKMNVNVMPLGAAIKKIIAQTPRKEKDSTVANFLKLAQESFTECGLYLQKKLPLNNELLQCISAIDPRAIGHKKTANALEKLHEKVLCLNEEEWTACEKQIRKIGVNTSLPSAEDCRVDHWWFKVAQLDRYNDLCKLVYAVLSIFHGPKVESSFNTMGDVIDIRSCQMKVETYSAMQTVKYHLNSRGSSAIKYFSRSDIAHDPVDKQLSKNLLSSAKEHNKQKEKKRTAKLERKKLFELKEKIMSKAEHKREVAKREKAGRIKALKELVKRKKRFFLT